MANKGTSYITNPKGIPIEFQNVQEMVDYSFNAEGDFVKTLGYFSAGDYGGNTYEITSTMGTDEWRYIQLSTGLFAKGLFLDGVYRPQQFGAVADAVDNLEGTTFKGDWATSTSYVVGDRVQAPSHRRGYVCVEDHTSSVFDSDVSAGRWEIGEFSGTDSRSAFEVMMQAGLPVTLTPNGKFVWREPPNNQSSPGIPFVDLSADHPDIHIIGAEGAWIFLDEDVPTRLADGNGTASFGIDTGAMSEPEMGKYGTCRFINLNVRSRWSHYPGTNNDSGQNGSGFNWCRIEGYSLFEVVGGVYEDFRQKVTRNRHNARVRIHGTKGYRLAKGMWREVNSQNVTATENFIDGSGDDSLDFIFVQADGSSDGQAAGGYCDISRNTILNGENIQSQGFCNLKIEDNLISRSHTNGISCNVGSSSNDKARVNISVSRNIITDVMMPWDENTMEIATSSNEEPYIAVRGGNRTSASTAAAPGTYDAASGSFVLPYGYMNTKSSEASSSSGGMNVSITGNVMSRTLPVGVSYTDWGYGMMFSPVGYVDATVEENNMVHYGAVAYNDIESLLISENQTLGIAYPSRIASTNSEDEDKAFKSVVIKGNIFLDCTSGFSHSKVGGASYYSWDVTVTGNTFDCDPYMTSQYRTTPLDGSWESGVSVLDAPCGIQARNLAKLTFGGNRFRNCYYPVVSNTAGSPGRVNINLGGNVIEAQPTSDVYSASNKGIAIPGSGADFSLIEIDSDPTSATYGEVLNRPISTYSSYPSSGTYLRGAFVKNTSGTSLGWLRMTNGSGHVIGTDWKEVGA